jgi:hypothetical protein
MKKKRFSVYIDGDHDESFDTIAEARACIRACIQDSIDQAYGQWDDDFIEAIAELQPSEPYWTDYGAYEYTFQIVDNEMYTKARADIDTLVQMTSSILSELESEFDEFGESDPVQEALAEEIVGLVRYWLPSTC